MYWSKCLYVVGVLALAGTAVWTAGAEETAAPDATDELLRAVRVMSPVSYKQITVFPVRLSGAYTDFLPRTFDEAVKNQELIVQELEQESVNTVRVRNVGTRPVFIMAGEIMSGSKQDRTVQRDVLIPAKSDWLELPVYCVEAGRWTVVSPTFGTRSSLAAPALRKDAYTGASQSAIWAQVDQSAAANAVAQGSGRAFQEIYDDKQVQARIAEHMAALRIPGTGTAGLVAFRGTEPLGCDLFSTSALFSRLKDKVLRSYILSVGVTAPQAGESRGGAAPSAMDAAKYLAAAWAGVCRREQVPTPGIGTSLKLENKAAQVGGGALAYEGSVLHFSLFPDNQDIPVPAPLQQGLQQNLNQAIQQRIE